MTLQISAWGVQGQRWWIHVVSEARMERCAWLNMTPREKARLEGIYPLGEELPIPPKASKHESILR
eukprot:12911709-Prorocentrum_lima.AAC.1